MAQQFKVRWHETEDQGVDRYNVFASKGKQISYCPRNEEKQLRLMTKVAATLARDGFELVGQDEEGWVTYEQVRPSKAPPIRVYPSESWLELPRRRRTKCKVK